MLDGSSVTGPLHFVDNDRDYLYWTRTHPRGFVVNSYKQPKADYLVLHWADCQTINGAHLPWTTGDYRKVCSEDRAVLEQWAVQLGGELSRCSFCWDR
jgi:hypothetical protein